MLKRSRDRHGKDTHPMDRTVEDTSRRARIEQSQREFEEILASSEDQQRGLEFLGERIQYQFNRVSGNTFSGRPLQDIIDLAPENIAYVVEHIGEHERGTETYNTEKGTRVSITIVDFTRPVV